MSTVYPSFGTLQCNIRELPYLPDGLFNRGILSVHPMRAHLVYGPGILVIRGTRFSKTVSI
jgi:hypothetical protein